MTSYKFKTVKNVAFNLICDPSETIEGVKQKVADHIGGVVGGGESVKLICAGGILKNEKTLSECNVTDSVIVVMITKKAPPASVEPPAPVTPMKPPSTNQKPPPIVAAPTPKDAPGGAEAPGGVAEAPGAAETGTVAGAPGVVPASATSAPGLLSGEALEEAKKVIEQLGFTRERIDVAMRQAFNNPDRAVEYLLHGFPVQAAHPQGGEAPPPAALPQGSLPLGAPSQIPSTDQDESMQGAQISADQDPLEALRRYPQFQQLRQVVQMQPEMLPMILQQIGQQNPELLAHITQNQEAFMQLLSETGAPPAAAGRSTITLNQQEHEAVVRLQTIGFSQSAAIEAYFACDKNEDLAANYLLENSGDFGEGEEE
eukprot:GHVL01013994.1.p1 GENE.GHVL01013994.1~~GHVL01013994.1.p1  ORF type:complete len:371 (+),score=103.54 GHVL01013994.1:30-1142(+)